MNVLLSGGPFDGEERWAESDWEVLNVPLPEGEQGRQMAVWPGSPPPSSHRTKVAAYRRSLNNPAVYEYDSGLSDLGGWIN